MGQFSISLSILALTTTVIAGSWAVPVGAATLPASLTILQARAYECVLSGPSGLPCVNPDVEGRNSTSVRNGTSNSFSAVDVSLSLAPRLDASSTAGLPGGGALAGRSVNSGTTGLLTYAFRVDGPVGQTVSVLVQAAGKTVTSTDGLDLYFARASAQLSIRNARVGLIYDQIIQSEANGLTAVVNDIDSFSLNRRFDFVAGEINGVSMSISTSTQAFVDALRGGAGLSAASAMLDPYFQLDPADLARGFSLSFSEGINNALPGPVDPGPAPVPLPAGSPLLGAALLMLGGLARRARRRQA
jgi:MYXO-CTERM domain-containing protein